MAEVLLDDYDVVAFDIDPARLNALGDRGASLAESAKEVGAKADVVLLSLPNDDALEAATLDDEGVIAGLSAGDVLVDTSTVSPTASRRVADACDAGGVDFLDAPVSGGARNAETGSLTILVGGPPDVLASVRPVLETVGETIHRVGPTGSGVTLKVINNYLFGVHQIALAEGLSLAREAGIPDDVFAEVVGDSSGASYALDRNVQRFIIPDDYDSEFTLSLMRKDVQMAEKFANANDVPLLLGSVSGLYRLGEALGHGDLDSSAIVKLYEAIGSES